MYSPYYERSKGMGSRNGRAFWYGARRVQPSEDWRSERQFSRYVDGLAVLALGYVAHYVRGFADVEYLTNLHNCPIKRSRGGHDEPFT